MFYSTFDDTKQRLPQVSRKLSFDTSIGASNSTSMSQKQLINKKNCNTYFTPVVLSHNRSQSDNNKSIKVVKDSSSNQGYLDGFLSSPTRIPRIKKIDSKKIAVILLETNVLELQRNLLTVTVQNQVSLI